MADPGIKKVTILNNQLPLVSYDPTDLYYDIRYRIISEDKNRVSHWSKVNRIIMPPTTDADLPYTSIPRITIYSINADTGKAITSAWTFPQNPSDFNPDPYKAELERRFAQVSFFDIWVRWSPDNSGGTWSDWKYESRISSNSYTILRQETPFIAKRINIRVQIPTALPTYDTRLSLFDGIHQV